MATLLRAIFGAVVIFAGLATAIVILGPTMAPGVLGLGGAVFLIWAGLWIGLRRPRRDADDADRVPCPFCAEKIKPEASRCPFCRSDLAAGRPSDARLPRRRPF